MMQLEDLQSQEKELKMGLWTLIIIMGVLYTVCLSSGITEKVC